MHRLLFTLIPAFALDLPAMDRDLVIYGGTPSGLAAGITAAREGADVLVIEPTPWIGGLVTGGLARTDVGNKDTIGGFPLEFFSLAGTKVPEEFLWYADPHINMATFEDLILESGIEVIRGQRLVSVEVNDRRILSVTTDDGTRHEGAQFIDASYEGDLMAMAGVSYLVGRESRDEYGESLAGFTIMPVRERSAEIMSRAGKPAYIHGTPARISALAPDGSLLFGVFKTDPTKKQGDADGHTQAYNYRITVTQRPELLVPFPKPEDYDADRYELLLRLIEAYPKVAFGRIFHLGEIANGKFDLNAQGLFSTDHPGYNTEYPDGDWPTREEIIDEHITHLQGMLWFLCHDARVPSYLREETATWGLCKDEFVDNGHWPYALYIREGRRMKGAYVMRQEDLTANIKKPDSIGMGSFLIDCHIVQRVVTEDGNVTDEGSFMDTPARPYQIPYRSLTPIAAECENLLVTVCLSASHIAYCSMRMEPVYMAMGQAAGLAALQAGRSGDVQSIDLPALQAKLLEQKAVIDLDLPDLTLSTNLPGIVLDDQTAIYTGDWTSSSYGNPIDGASRHDGGDGQGQKSARFEVTIPESGTYSVRVAYVSAPNRASNIPVLIEYSGGRDKTILNQKSPPTGDPHFATIGEFHLEAGSPAAVTILNENADGIVGIDAVQWILKSGR